MKTLGYVVYCDKSGPMLLSKHDDLLYFGSVVTLFASRELARRAIKRTIEEQKENFDRDFEKDFGKLRIKRVAEAS